MEFTQTFLTNKKQNRYVEKFKNTSLLKLSQILGFFNYGYTHNGV